MGQMMGKMTPGATNQVDANGNVVATDTPGSRTVSDPNQGLSGGQMFVRKALAGGLAGGGNALQRQGGMTPAPSMRAGAPSGIMPMQPNFAQQSQQLSTASTQPVVPPQNTGTVGLPGANSNSPFPRGPRQSLFYGGPGGF